jgi:hypothetical protein
MILSFLFRTTADWTMTIIGWLDLKLAMINIYNNRLAEDTQRNTFTTTAGRSF